MSNLLLEGGPAEQAPRAFIELAFEESFSS